MNEDILDDDFDKNIRLIKLVAATALKCVSK